MNRVLVFGASGFIGQALLPRLNQNVTAISRAKIMDDTKTIKWCTGDLTKESTKLPHNLIQHASVAYYLGPIFSNGLLVAKNAIKIAEESNVKRLIIISLLGSHVHSSDPWHQSNYESELIAINSAIPEVVIVRVPLLVSRTNSDSKFEVYMKGLMNLPLIYPVLRSKDKCSLAAVEDLAIYLSKLHNAEISDPRNIVDFATTQFSMKAIFSKVKIIHCKKKKLGLGSFLGAILAKAIDFFTDKRGDRIKTRQMIQHIIASRPENDVPPGVPNPRLYKSVEDVYTGA
jgi:uncharacterized protein YbjT (DUF2867 family)